MTPKAAPTPPPVTQSASSVSDAEELVPQESLEQALAADASENVMKRKNTWLYSVGILFTAGVIGVSGFVFMLSLRPKSAGPAPSAAAVTDMVTPTAVLTDEPSSVDMTIEVLNASGVAGAAGKLAGTLGALGYTVVKVGNAPKAEASTVSFVSTISDQQKQNVLSDLALSGVRAREAGALTGSTASARIIVGSDE